MDKIVFVDSEISREKIVDLGAIKDDGSEFHANDVSKFEKFISKCNYYVGHNIVHHDAKYIGKFFWKKGKMIDTLYLSPLLFPEKPYHKLLKDEKIITDELNNPLSDSKKCKDLFYDELTAFNKLDKALQNIYGTLLYNKPEFEGFFSYVEYQKEMFLDSRIKKRFKSMICENANIKQFINDSPVELAYALSIISILNNDKGKESITPPWVLKQYPIVEHIMKVLRGTPCGKCDYCTDKFDAKKRLKSIFGHNDFRLFNGENLQEKAVNAAINGKSLLAIFPTGGGKSITFQIPALIAGETERALTVIISPLQSLMKDQVDNLEKKGSADAVTINGLLNNIERAKAIELITNGIASILYIAPESLRSNTIENIIASRNIARFVIDEAHCFSSWGQDFRVDYQYIGEFINNIAKKKGIDSIPVSCFTATAKQKVVSDILGYFKEKCGLSLDLFTTSVERANLTYNVIPKKNDEEKYHEIRDLINKKNCSTIVFVSSVKQTYDIAERLTRDGIKALPFNGQMDSDEKVENQNAFMNDGCQVMVATNAFGMGVDKSDIKLVIHFDISDSLENYIQEAGRAGRDQSLQAECYVLFCEDDLNKHFIKLNQSKLTINEIQQIWKAIKQLSKGRTVITNSALEIARDAGWDDSIRDIETRVKTAINELENSGYIKRGKNSPRVFATSIKAKSLIEAKDKALKSGLFEEYEIENMTRILSKLISSRSVKKAQEEDAESRVDYIADRLGIDKDAVITIIYKLRQADVLADEDDMTATISKDNRSIKILDQFSTLENFMMEYIEIDADLTDRIINLKELNEAAINNGYKNSSVKAIKTILFFWIISGYIKKNMDYANDDFHFCPLYYKNELISKIEHRLEISDFIVNYLLNKAIGRNEIETVGFSIVELVDGYNNGSLFANYVCNVEDIKDAILYLTKIKSMNIEGGFLVLYSGMQITRLENNNQIQYKKEDYKRLQNYYNLRIQQIHIVGEYANMMVSNYDLALEFVKDYFSLEYDGFIKKYFKGNRKGEIQKNITPNKYNMLFGELSETQKSIIDDGESRFISVIAGPGSGKTRVLVHKLASLLLLEDTKAEQLLMLTFSRNSATEFKKRLIDLIGNAAYFVDIKTFHSYCFDLIGKNGNDEEFEVVIKNAVEVINSGDVEPGKITKSVLVIDEAQDMSEDEYSLIQSIISKNEDMRLIAVGDDDQNIYEFRGSSPRYLQSFIDDYGAKRYELLENYRSVNKIVRFANAFAKRIRRRLKTNPIVSMKNDDGFVGIYEYGGQNFEEPIAEQISKNNGEGTIAVLTYTNEDALRIMGSLSEKGIKARLIQTDEKTHLSNYIEMRFFISCIINNVSPTINKDDWRRAKQKLIDKYAKSALISYFLKAIDTFEAITNELYINDFLNYAIESTLEDFMFDQKEKIIVSTIHKAKGQEFETVFLMLRNKAIISDEDKRKVYVGMTRAKKNLLIHENRGSFDSFKDLTGIKYKYNDKVYDKPKKLALPLNYTDVTLGFFKDKEAIISSLVPGDILEINDVYLVHNKKFIARIAVKYQQTINVLHAQGYKICYAKVEKVVYWKGKDEEKEVLIILPTLYLEYDESLVEKNDNNEDELFKIS